MDRRTIAALVVAASLVGCDSEPEPIEVAPAEFAELCGHEGPVRILRFEPWRATGAAYYWRSFGERRVVSVLYEDTGVASRVLWSTGPCGEAPRQLVSGRFDSMALPPYDLPFVCDDGQIRVLDPTGERAPRHVFDSPTCLVRSTDAGLVGIWPDAVDSETGSLILQPWVDDVWTDDAAPLVLLDSVETHRASPGTSEWDTLLVDEGGVLVVTGDHELVRVTIPDGEVEVIATDVRTFRPSYDLENLEADVLPHQLLLQRNELSNDDPEDPEGEILLLDRDTDQLTSLGQGGLHWMNLGALRWTNGGFIALRLRVGGELVLRLYRLPSLEFIDVAETLDPRFLFGDNRHLLVKVSEDTPWGILDIETGELWIPPTAMSFEYRWEPRAATALVPDHDDSAEGQLFRLTEHGPPELIARRTSGSYRFMPDGRLLTGVGLDDDGVGDLIVVDPETLEERLVDRGISAWQAWIELDGADELVAYPVLDGDRAGLWLARLQPASGSR